ncbi:hypothetical protein [Streptomyces mexicanus]|jgi:hypothetical protein|uniref:hypothetical protein n=1 Tax=Streptomyces mexicanus TaxID=178566 RepID=UPI0036AA8A30
MTTPREQPAWEEVAAMVMPADVEIGGLAGDDVRTVQRALIARGHDIPNGVTGFIDEHRGRPCRRTARPGLHRKRRAQFVVVMRSEKIA